MFLKFCIDFKNKKCYSYTLNQHKGIKMQKFKLMYSVETKEYELVERYISKYFTDVEFQKRLHADEVREIHFLGKRKCVIETIKRKDFESNSDFVCYADLLALGFFLY